MTYIEGADFIIRFAPLPYGVHGCITESADGFFCIYVNSRDCHERQRKAADHERRHIEDDDFSKYDVREAEGI